VFLPGFKPANEETENEFNFPEPELNFIDHCVGNQPDLTMESVAQW